MKATRQLLSLVWPYRWWVVLAISLNWGTICSSIGLLMTSAYVISRAALQPSIAELQVAIVGIRFFGILRGVLRYLERLVSHNVHFKLLSELRLRFFSAIEPRFPQGVGLQTSGTLHQQVVSDMETLKFFFIRWIAPVVSAVLVLASIVLALMPFGIQLSLITGLLFGLGGWLIPWLTTRLVRKRAERLTQMRADIHESYVESLQGLSDLKSHDAWSRRMESLERSDETFLREQRSIKSIAAFQENAIHLLMIINVILALWIMIPFVESGATKGYFLAVVVMGIMASYEAVLPLPTAAAFQEKSKAAWKRIQATMSAAESESVSKKEFPTQRSIDSISFKNVSFSYLKDNPMVLKNLTFEVIKGDRILIMGASGGGKSTIINLLTQLYQPVSGVVSINRNDSSVYSPDSIRELFSVAQQTPWLFNETILNNLTFGCQNIAQNQVTSATQTAQIHDFIESLPDGYHTTIGELGHRLSGGERQRLAIARALLKQSPVLVLDEPSSNLDVNTEKALLSELHMRPDFDQIWTISHRIVNPAWHSNVFILQNGKIVENGSPSTLLQNSNSLFARYWKEEQQYCNG